MAKFIIKSVLLLNRSNDLFIIGEIVEGLIKKGMKFNLQENKFTITGIESIDGNLNNTLVSHIALKINSKDKALFDSSLTDKKNGIEIDIS